MLLQDPQELGHLLLISFEITQRDDIDRYVSQTGSSVHVIEHALQHFCFTSGMLQTASVKINLLHSSLSINLHSAIERSTKCFTTYRKPDSNPVQSNFLC